MFIKYFLPLLLLHIHHVICANILFISPLPSPSHHFWNSAISYELAKRGHNLTIISPDADKNPPNGTHYILLETLYTDFRRESVRSFFRQRKPNAFTQGFDYANSWDHICIESVKTHGFRQLLNYPDHFRFDLVLYDFSVGPCLLPFVQKFGNPPIVAVTAYSNPSFLNQLVGGHKYYAYVPHKSVMFNDNMNFFQRFYNLVIHFEEYILLHEMLLPKWDKMLKTYFDFDFPPLSELQQRTKIALVNTNPTIDYNEPSPENVIPVAGLHIKESQPLPRDLEEFCDSAKKGIVLFALGSNIKAEDMPIDKQKLFIDVFRNFSDYNFLWKIESSFKATEVPKNVMIRSWLPQSDVLAHPKSKAFITHGGLLSMQEAIWRGVPLIVMPFAFDQQQNFVRSRDVGIAEGLDFHSLTKSEIHEKLQKVLESSKYADNIKRVSTHFKDQKEKPLERAVWWIEWVLRNPDCDYLKSPVLRLGNITGSSFDLVAVSAVVLLLTLMFLCKLMVWLTTRLFYINLPTNYLRPKMD